MDNGTEKIDGVSSEAVQAKTGKSWDEWFAILDAAGAQAMEHPQIARYLQDQYGVPDWWCQMVTVGYEQARGMRQVHQKTDGFTANASRTIAAPVAALSEAWTDDAVRERWLPGAAMTVRKATPGKSVRIAWGDGTLVDVYLTAKGDNKGQVAIQHSKLGDEADAAAMKTYWSEALDRMKRLLER